MKKTLPAINPLPGASPGEGPKILIQIIHDLTPELHHYPGLVKRLEHFVMTPDLRDIDSGEAVEKLRRDIASVVGDKSQKNLDILFHIMEGMQVAMEYMALQSAVELDSFLQMHKEAFAARLFGLDDPKSTHGLTRIKNKRSDRLKT